MNALIHETSPYLLQHAHNPVEWYPWSRSALDRAVMENKPILVSIGYSACHWCHVMERESFEDPETAAYMNEHFVNIKIDREERPDLDHIYMDAVQAMTGSGGWPLNVFLTPAGKPFYGGTYFPPRRAFNRPSWLETLQGVTQAFAERRHEVDAQAENLTDHLLQSNGFGQQQGGGNQFDQGTTAQIAGNLLKTADKEWGGFGKAPKFPQTFSIQYLLRYYHLSGDREALDQALLSLDRMIEGGIFDQLGGGFARYSTDTEWLAPHFEKMLYDNALLVSVLSEAYQLTKKERYREVIKETMDFIRREMLDTGHGFYAALDADSEGVEGKFYVWSQSEISEVLGEDAGIFCRYYDVTEHGNWDHTNILRTRKPLEVFAVEEKRKPAAIRTILEKCREKLMNRRNKRTRPGLDDKIILGWNALMNTACSKAFAATGETSYREMAVANMNFLLKKFSTGVGEAMHHTWKKDQAKYPAFLDDYAFLIEALMHLQEITAERIWLKKAKRITEHVLDHFDEPGTGYFYYTGHEQDDVIVRKKELYDGAVPSGNSVMAVCLHRLGILFDLPSWRERSASMVASLGSAIVKYPGSFGNWAGLIQELATGTSEIAMIGEGAIQQDILSEYIPYRVLMFSKEPDPGYPLLAGKVRAGKPAIYLCRNYTCQAPVFSAVELISLINKAQNR